jgi:hypothetical protein
MMLCLLICWLSTGQPLAADARNQAYEHKKPKSTKDKADANWPMSGPIESRSNAKTTKPSHASGRNQRDEKTGATGLFARLKVWVKNLLSSRESMAMSN